jgi:hypothetical protein
MQIIARLIESLDFVIVFKLTLTRNTCPPSFGGVQSVRLRFSNLILRDNFNPYSVFCET